MNADDTNIDEDDEYAKGLYYGHTYTDDDDVKTNGLLHDHNMSDDDVRDQMVDIDGEVNGEDVYPNYLDDEAFEVNSDTYTTSATSNTNDCASFINDDSTDYESTDNSSGDDKF